MARNSTLEKVLTDLRAEARLSLSAQHNINVRDPHIALIQREQERLYGEFDWPHLVVERFIPMQAGQRFYDPKVSFDEMGRAKDDIHIERIAQVDVKTDNEWFRLATGIGAAEYAAHDSFLDQRAWPTRRWRLYEDEMIEVWPVPDQDADPATQNGYLRITGVRKLRPLAQNGDRLDLDDQMVVLFAAATLLAASGAKDAQLKLEAANRRFSFVKGRLVPTQGFRMFGIGERPLPKRPFISRYKPPTG